MDLQQILSFVLPDPDDCRQAAAELRLQDPNLTPEQSADLALKQSRKWAASIGAATGAVASPLTMMPAAIADAVAMLRLEGKLAGTIAALLAPETLDNPDAFHRDVMRSVFPGAVSQTLRRMGVRAGEQAAKSAVAHLATRAGTKEVTERATKLLGIRLAEKAVASKAVPLVGAAIGAAWNYAEVHAVGRRAIDHHMGRQPPERRAVTRIKSFARTQHQKLSHRLAKRPETRND